MSAFVLPQVHQGVAKEGELGGLRLPLVSYGKIGVP